MSATLVDETFAGFIATLAPGLREATAQLPVALSLVPRSGVPLSEVFSHPVTLSAAALVAEGVAAPDDVVRRATLVHTLSVLQAFAIDRIEDAQVKLDDLSYRAITSMAQHRDAALVELGVGPEVPRGAEEDTYAAIAMEGRILRGECAPLAQAYERISRRKQALGLLGTRGLCAAAELPKTQAQAIVGWLEDVATALQFEDDVVDWEDDFQHERSWMVVLADSRRRGLRPKSLAEARRLVFRSGVLAQTLASAASLYDVVATGFGRIGARSLSEWARDRQRQASARSTSELEAPGFTVREHALRRLKRAFFG